MKRRFGRRERNELYVASNGKCSQCGVDLDETWHADHVIPFAAGGETDLRNGQALCRACNLRKGATMHKDQIELRPHQAAMTSAMMNKVQLGQKTLIGNIFPGSGKTTGYLNTAQTLYRNGLIDTLVTVVPRVNLAQQVEGDWNKIRHLYAGSVMGRVVHRGNEAPLFRTANGQPNFGYVTTYSSMTSRGALDLHLRELRGRRFLLIVDESHQLGFNDFDDEDANRSSEVIGQLGEHAQYIVSVTGTPIREDGNRLLFAEYDADGYLVADVKALYRDGVGAEIPYLRRFEFEQVNATGVYTEIAPDGQFHDSNLELRSMRGGIGKIVSEPTYWREMVDRTVQKVREVQLVNRNLCGLIGAYDQRNAHQIEAYLKKHHPSLRVLKAVSAETNAHDHLKKFRAGGYDILITVAMAHVGFDHPPISVICMLSPYRTWAWVLQFLGRGLRVYRDPKTESVVDVPLLGICPGDPRALEIFQWLRTESQDAVASRKQKDDQDREREKEPREIRIGYVKDVEVGETTAIGNDGVADAEAFMRWDAARRRHGIPHVPLTTLKAIFEEENGQATAAASLAPVAMLDRQETEDEQIDRLGRELSRLARRRDRALAVSTEPKWGTTYVDMKAAFGGKPADKCGVDELIERLLWCQAQLRKVGIDEHVDL